MAETHEYTQQSFSLTQDAVTERLNAYSTPELVLPVATALGNALLDEQLNRTTAIESKAGMALGFAVVALAFLLTDSKHPPTSAVDITLWVVALGGASSAALFAYLALEVSAWPWFSDAIWLPEPTWLQNAEHLQAHYVDYQHRTLSHLQPLNERKAAYVQRCQRALVLTAGALALRAVLVFFVGP